VGLILDSSVAIEAERRGDTVRALLQRVIDWRTTKRPRYPPSESSNSSTESTVRIPPNAWGAVTAFETGAVAAGALNGSEPEEAFR
jgi:hypothetical protein